MVVLLHFVIREYLTIKHVRIAEVQQVLAVCSAMFTWQPLSSAKQRERRSWRNSKVAKIINALHVQEFALPQWLVA